MQGPIPSLQIQHNQNTGESHSDIELLMNIEAWLHQASKGRNRRRVLKDSSYSALKEWHIATKWFSLHVWACICASSILPWVYYLMIYLSTYPMALEVQSRNLLHVLPTSMLSIQFLAIQFFTNLP